MIVILDILTWHLSQTLIQIIPYIFSNKIFHINPSLFIVLKFNKEYELKDWQD